MPLTRRDLLGAAALSPVLMRVEDALAQGIQPRRGGILQTMLTPEPPILIPGVNNQGPTLIASSKIFQGLLSYSPKLDPLPALAKSWSISDDKRSYTFVLQDNVKWHDGKPFTAEDVVFSVTKFHKELSPRARPVLDRIVEASAPNPHTAVFTLDKPFEPFMLMFDVTTIAIMPKHIYEGTDYRTNPANQHPIGTGPFKFTEWQRGNFMRFDRFDDYWKPGQPYLDAIIYRIVPDGQSRALALQTGQAALSQSNDIEPFDVPRFRQMANLEVRTTGWEYFSPLSMLDINHRVKPLDDPRVRRAFAHAIDRNFIAQKIWFGVGKPATGPVSSTTRFYDPSAKMPGYDPNAAMQLLDAAGLKPDGSGVRAKIKHLVIPYGEVWTRQAEYLRQAMRKVGIDLQLETVDAGSWSNRIAQWNYETSVNYLYQYGDPTLGVERSYVSTNIKKINFTNTGGYINPKVDELFAEGRNASAPEDRQKAFFAVQKILVEEVPVVWLLDMAFATINERKLHNVIELGTGVHACFDDVFLAS